MKGKSLLAGAVGLFAGVLLGLPAWTQAPAKPLKVQESNVEDINAEVVEAVRKEGVLTVKLRFRNTGASPAKVTLARDSSDFDKFYVVSGNTKALILRDTSKVPLMTPANVHGNISADVKPNGSTLFWAKYPAPPASAKKFTLFTPLTPPIEDIPIAEAQ